MLVKLTFHIAASMSNTQMPLQSMFSMTENLVT